MSFLYVVDLTPRRSLLEMMLRLWNCGGALYLFQLPLHPVKGPISRGVLISIDNQAYRGSFYYKQIEGGTTRETNSALLQLTSS